MPMVLFQLIKEPSERLSSLQIRIYTLYILLCQGIYLLPHICPKIISFHNVDVPEKSQNEPTKSTIVADIYVKYPLSIPIWRYILGPLRKFFYEKIAR